MVRLCNGSSILAGVMLSGMVLHSSGQAFPQPPTPVLQAQADPSEASNWQDFVSVEGGYSVLMPSPPVEFLIPSDLNTGEVQMFMQMRLADAETMELYGVAVTDYGEEFSTPEAVQYVLEGCQEPFSVGDRLVSSQPIQLGTHEGIEVEFQTVDGGFNVAQCYFVGQRFYMLMAMVEPFAIDDTAPFSAIASPLVRTQTMDLFLNSFQLLD